MSPMQLHRRRSLTQNFLAFLLIKRPLICMRVTVQPMLWLSMFMVVHGSKVIRRMFMRCRITLQAIISVSPQLIILCNLLIGVR